MAGGITNLVNAFTGGDKYEMEAFNNQMNQMVAAGTREAALAKKLAEAEIVRDQLSGRQGLRDSFEGSPEELNALIAGLAPDLDQIVRSRGSRRALDLSKDMTGTDGINAAIAIAAEKMMTPENVAIEGQAQAKISEANAAARLRDAQATEASAGAAHKTAQAKDVNRQTELRSNVPGSNFTLTRDQSSLLTGWGIQDEDGETQEINMLPAFYAFMMSPEGMAMSQQAGPQGAFTYFVSELVQGNVPGPVGVQAPGQTGGETKSNRRFLYNTDTGEFTPHHLR